LPPGLNCLRGLVGRVSDSDGFAILKNQKN
jgi:hypothetical protein